MNFKGVLLDMTQYSVYVMMRKNGSPAKDLEYFTGHAEFSKQYSDSLGPEEYGRALIEAANYRGLMQ